MTKRREDEWKVKLESTKGMAQWIAIYQAYNAIFKVIELALLPHHLSLPQVQRLARLKTAGGTLTTSEVSRAMVSQRQTVTATVDRLQRLGLVERISDERDRRKTCVRLTEEGERKLGEAFTVVSHFVEEIFTVLSDQELGELQASVDRLGRAAMDRLDASELSSSRGLSQPVWTRLKILSRKVLPFR